ncbi:MAG: SGNH/GDSL hydrolase family protein [Smithella sp.]
MNKTSQRVAVLLLVFISTIDSLYVAELVLRHYLPLNEGTTFEHRIPHPVLGWTSEPGLTFNNRMDEATVSVFYNKAGFHDREHAYENPAGAYRIVVLGDSFMEAYSVELGGAFHSLIEKIAKSKGIDVEVINLGVGGYGTLQEYLAYREIGRKYKPDLVLLAFNSSNDVRDNSREIESLVIGSRVNRVPYVDLSGPGGWNITPVDYAGAMESFKKGRAETGSIRATLERRSVIFRMVSKEVSRNIRKLSKKFDAGQERDSVSPTARQDDFYRSGIYYCNEPEAYTRAWEITERIVQHLKQEIERDRAKLVVLSVPAIAETYPAATRKANPSAGKFDPLCYEDPPGYGRSRDLFRKFNLEYIDLLPVFRKKAGADGIYLFRKSDRHWNEDGHALAAQVVFSTLEQKGYFKTAKR